MGAVTALIDGVNVHYGKYHALRDISFSVREGEVVGLLGHNGAGKTTTIRLLNGLIRPTSGSVHVLGVDPLSGGGAFRSLTSVVTDSLGLHERETARQAMAFHSQLWSMDRAFAAERSEELLLRFGLGSAIDTPVKAFSRGMRQRLALARSLLHGPRLLLLDEPTLGMDPVGRQEFRTILRTVTDEGTAVLMSTHDLGEVEKACDNIVILHQGEVVLKGAAASTVTEFTKNVDVTIEFIGHTTIDVVTSLHGLTDVTDIQFGETAVDFVATDRAAIANAVKALSIAGLGIVGVRSNEPTLEDVYLAMHSEDRK